jgi:major membrane immunogen (membrane-anchored lipoprotein)
MRKIGAVLLLTLFALLASCSLPELTLVGWGNIFADGTIRGSSENFTVDHPAAGDYRIVWTDDTEVTAINSGGTGGLLAIKIYASGTPANYAFSFAVYQW